MIMYIWTEHQQLHKVITCNMYHGADIWQQGFIEKCISTNSSEHDTCTSSGSNYAWTLMKNSTAWFNKFLYHHNQAMIQNTSAHGSARTLVRGSASTCTSVRTCAYTSVRSCACAIVQLCMCSNHIWNPTNYKMGSQIHNLTDSVFTFSTFWSTHAIVHVSAGSLAI